MNKNLIRDISLVLNVIAIMIIALGIFTFQSEIKKLESENASLQNAVNLLKVELLEAQREV